MAGVKYKVFSYEDGYTQTEPGFFGNSEFNYLYEEPEDLRDAVAQFIEELGDKFISLTGDSLYQAMAGQRHGEITVWYRA